MTTSTTMNAVNRVEFLRVLEAVYPGISPKADFEQADSFCFRKGFVYTYNGDILGRAKTSLNEGIIAAVYASPLLATLREMEHEEIFISITERKGAPVFQIKAKRDTVWVHCNPKIVLPYQDVEKPESWRPLAADFSEGLELVSESANEKDTSDFMKTCVHIHPKWVEATDMFSFSRFNVKTGVDKGILIRVVAARAIAGRQPDRISLTKDWAHFRTGPDLRLSTRRFYPEQQQATELLKAMCDVVGTHGKRIIMPKSLIKKTDLAEIFSEENKGNNFVTVRLDNGEIHVSGVGVSGGMSHRGKVHYSDKPIMFTISPAIFKGLIDKNNEVEILQGRLIVCNNRYYYTTYTKAVQKEVTKESN